MSTVDLSKFGLQGAERLSRAEMKGVVGATTPPSQCILMSGVIVDCYTESSSDCIEILENGG